MKTIYLLFKGYYEKEELVEMFETREQAELYCDVYGYYIGGIEERQYYEKGDKFPTSNLWWRITPIALSRLANYDNQIHFHDLILIKNHHNCNIKEDLNFIDAGGNLILVEFNIKANNRTEALIKANKRCKELQDYFKSLLEKK